LIENSFKSEVNNYDEIHTESTMTTTSNESDPINESDWAYARKQNRELIEETRACLPRIFRLTLGVMTLGILLILGGALVALVDPAHLTPAIIIAVSGVLALLIGTTCLIIYRSTMTQARAYINEPLTTDSFEAARRKIQYYMHENLNQVRWIFWLSLVAMFLGFLIILCGAALAVVVPNQLAPSVVVTLSGVLVEFLGATFLVIYKSTMEQAQGYVNVLERINAVGMSVKLIDAIEKGEDRDKFRGQVASAILSVHGLEKSE
jgi:hypothetical protein